jgi:hypothetical protein
MGAPSIAALAALLFATPNDARADETRPTLEDAAADRFPLPTPLWAIVQLVPSPEWLVSSSGLTFGLRWQVTPVLYSFGIHRRLSPWRLFIAEPNVRHGGSVELFGSPEYLALAGARDPWGVRAGVRAYFPLYQAGEYLAASIGSSYFYFDGSGSMAVEAGAYILFGIVGVVVSVSPTFAGGSTIATLRFRYF